MLMVVTDADVALYERLKALGDKYNTEMNGDNDTVAHAAAMDYFSDLGAIQEEVGFKINLDNFHYYEKCIQSRHDHEIIPHYFTVDFSGVLDVNTAKDTLDKLELDKINMFVMPGTILVVGYFAMSAMRPVNRSRYDALWKKVEETFPIEAERPVKKVIYGQWWRERTEPVCVSEVTRPE